MAYRAAPRREGVDLNNVTPYRGSFLIAILFGLSLNDFIRETENNYYVRYMTFDFCTGNIIRLPPATYEEYAASWPEGWGNNLPPLALYTVLHPDDEEAAKLVVQYMDRLAKYKSWRETANIDQDLSVSHSLVGFATALDMVYDRLDRTRRQLYVSKVLKVTGELYNASFTKWWGYRLLQVCKS